MGIVFSSQPHGERALNTGSLTSSHGPADAVDESYIMTTPRRTRSAPTNGQSGWLPESNQEAEASRKTAEITYPKLPPFEFNESKLPAEAAMSEEKASIEPTFTIPVEVLAKAKAAKEGTPESYWTHKLYTSPTNTKVKVHYCKSKQTTEAVLKQHFLGKPVIGFDIEWKFGASTHNGPKKNVSLVQIACEDRIILSHLGCFAKSSVEDLVAPTLKTVLEDENVLKCGVAIKADCSRVRKFLGVDTRSIMELSHLHKLVTYSKSEEYNLINKRLVSLTNQAEEHLGLPIFKGEVRGSDWSEPLNMEQILYAASDAYAGLKIFEELEKKRLALDPVPPLPYPAEENKPIRLADGIEIEVPAEDEAEDAPRATSPSAQAQEEAEADVEVCAEDLRDGETPVKSSGKGRYKAKPVKDVDPKLEAAAQFALHYKQTYPKSTVSLAQLRAYHIWQTDSGLTLPEICAVLRNPPLQIETVRGYILEALRLEGRGVMGSVAWLVDPLKTENDDGAAEGARGLELEKDRVRELLEGSTAAKTTWRLKGLWKMCNQK